MEYSSPEQRIIQFIEHLKESGAIRFYEQFFDKVGLRRQYFTSVRKGKNRFTTTQIEAICENYDVNANWIFGTEPNMYRAKRRKK